VPARGAAASVADLMRALDEEGTERALVMPNYGVPDADVSFALNELVLDACATDERISCALWVSPKPDDAERNDQALALAGERGVRALKTTFLLGGRPTTPTASPSSIACLPSPPSTTSSSTSTPRRARPRTSTGSATS